MSNNKLNLEKLEYEFYYDYLKNIVILIRKEKISNSGLQLQKPAISSNKNIINESEIKFKEITVSFNKSSISLKMEINSQWPQIMGNSIKNTTLNDNIIVVFNKNKHTVINIVHNILKIPNKSFSYNALSIIFNNNFNKTQLNLNIRLPKIPLINMTYNNGTIVNFSNHNPYFLDIKNQTNIKTKILPINLPTILFKNKIPYLLDIKKTITNKFVEARNSFNLKPILSNNLFNEKPKISIVEVLDNVNLNLYSNQNAISEKLSQDTELESKNLVNYNAIISKTGLETNIIEHANLEDESIDLDDIYKKLIFGIFGNVIPERPLIIMARKRGDFEYLEFLKRVLREVYRVKVGGLPEAKHISIENDMFLLIPLEFEAGGKILVVDLTKELGDKSALYKEKIKDRVEDRLREIFSQRFGFIVFYGTIKSIEDLKQRLNLYDRENKKYVARFLEPINLNISRPDIHAFLGNLMWGKIKNIEDKSIFQSFDTYVVQLEDAYWNKLEELTKDIDLISKVYPSSSPDEKDKESYTHYLVKAFTTKYLINIIKEEYKKKGISEEKAKEIAMNCVETEHETNDKTMRYDIYVNDICNSILSNLVIEVETLYGTGIFIHKLQNTIETRLNNTNKLWIIIPNQEAIIFLPTILKLKKLMKQKYPDKEIEFYTLNIENNSLISLNNIRKMIIEKLKNNYQDLNNT